MKISFKLGSWFFICLLLIEASSMIYLHRNVMHARVQQELDALQERGNSHRDVLEISSAPTTLQHIVLMESRADTEVVITNIDGEMLASSSNMSSSMQKIINQPVQNLPRQGLILQPDWENEKYLASVSFFNGENKNQGYVYMFKSTVHVQTFISQLNKHFLLASILILFFMLITIFFLSKALTKPLISMKEATKKLSNGDFTVSLPVMSNDELGELSKSISTLANDLKYMRQERNEFLASISHELRTPLTYIKGYSDIGRRTSLDDKERINYLNIIHEESDRLSELLKELFELAKLDQNSFTIVKERKSISTFLQSIYEKVLPAFKDKEIHLKLECEDHLFLSFDPIRFEQVLLNLLDNALKYSNEKTTTLMKAFEKNGNIHLVIDDAGIGIPKEDLPYVFDRLYRVEKSRSRATGGFGMGLSIVKELVEAHGGNISVESHLGQGTCFKIILKEH